MFSKRRDEEVVVIGPDMPSCTDPSVPAQACCCPARPAVKVIMPPTPARPHPVDLWLCGHHYHASMAALIAANVTVVDLTLPAEQPTPDRVAA